MTATAYRGCWIYSRTIRPGWTRHAWQDCAGVLHHTASIQGGKAAITRHLRALGLLDAPYRMTMSVNGCNAEVTP